MRKILIASNNKGKIKEFKEILKNLPVEIVTKKDLGINEFEIIEDGKTLKENSLKKARTLAEISNTMVIADDSGLFVDYLNGEPGIYSARYAGEDGNDKENNKKLLKELENVKNRNAKFKTVISLVTENKDEKFAIGECQGTINYYESGCNGFGYDPLFIPEGYEKTFAELGENIKNKISHRGIAMKKLVKIIEDLVKED